MSAIPTKDRIISVILFGAIIGIISQEAQITAIMGEYGPSATVLIAIVFVILREIIKEFGLQRGDLNTEETEEKQYEPQIKD
nr:unnamed protein product [uncultured archaeal virus]